LTLPSAQRWSELQPRVDELLALTPPERAQRLAALTQSDAQTAGELQALLAGLDDAHPLLSAAPPVERAFARAAPAAGDAVGPWVLESVLGRGGMGSVWRARRADGRFEAEVAIKLLQGGAFDQPAQERFRREGAILGRLLHPGIARLLDAGVTRAGQPYLVIDLVDGLPIDQWCLSQRLGVRATVELFVQVLDAVAAAHAQLVIHRDLKPSNIFVDAGGRVRLLDFGIARLLQDEAPGLTREGALALTPRYAAPEQFQGAALGTAADVYALGVVLFELLTGAHPSGLPAGATPLDHLQAATAGGFEPASRRAPARARELRGDLDTVLSHALEANPLDRYATVPALREDLQRFLRHEPVQARSAGPVYRLGKLLRRRPLESACVAAVVLAVPAGTHVQAAVLLSLAAGAGAALWQARRAGQQAAAAKAAQARAEAVKGFITSIFSQAVPRQGAGGVVTAADLLGAAATRVGRELKDQPEVAAELMALIASSFLDLGDVPAARRVLPEAVSRCERAFGRLHATTLRVRRQEVVATNVMGELAESERLLPPLLADLRARLPATARDLVAALRSHSFVLTKRGAEAQAVQALQDAWRQGREALGEDDDDTLSAAGLLGNTLNAFMRYPEAMQVLDETLELTRRKFGAQRPQSQLATVEGWHADVLANLGRLPQAVAELRQVLDDQLQLDGGDTSRNRFTRMALGRALADFGALDEALAQTRAALEVDKRLHPQPTVDKGNLQLQLGLLLVETGDAAAGLQAIEEAEATTQAAGSGQAKSALARRAHRAHALLACGRAEAALAEAEAVLQTPPAQAPGAHARAARTRVAALRQLGRTAQAQAQIQPMLDAALAAGLPPQIHWRACVEAAALHLACGQADQALERLEPVLPELAANQSPGSPLWLQALALQAQAQAGLVPAGPGPVTLPMRSLGA
jgi:serine/threonine-protein kinase